MNVPIPKHDVTTHTQPPQILLDLLKSHLPYSLPTLRRLQFMGTEGGRSAWSRVLTVGLSEREEVERGNWMIAFLDFSKGPNTELYIYCSLERRWGDNEGTGSGSEMVQRVGVVNEGLKDVQGSEEIVESHLVCLLDKVKEIEKEYNLSLNLKKKRENEGIILIGSLHGKLQEILEKRERVKSVVPEHLKFIFEMGRLPEAEGIEELGGEETQDGGGRGKLKWGTVTEEGLGMVLERGEIPYERGFLRVLKSVSIETDKGRMIAWTFLGLDGSLKSLHVEKDFRSQGLAKAIAIKLFHDSTALHPDIFQDGLFHADVDFRNLASQGVCKGLGGRKKWSIFYTWVIL